MLLNTCTTILACIATFVSATAISADTSGLNKRDVGTEIESQVTSLYDSVLPYDADINSTVASLNSGSTSAENATALARIRSDIESITTLINSAEGSISSLGKRSLSPRQASNETIDLADLLVTLLEEIDFTVNTLLNNLGLTGLVDLLTPLETALTTLVDAVGQLVDGVVNDVIAILDSLTTVLGTVLTGVLGGLLGGLLGGIL